MFKSNLCRILRIESVVFVNRTLFSTSAICTKKKGLIRKPLRIWTPEQAKNMKKLAQRNSENSFDSQNTRSNFPEALTNKRFTLPEGLSYVKLEDGDKKLK